MDEMGCFDVHMPLNKPEQKGQFTSTDHILTHVLIAGFRVIHLHGLFTVAYRFKTV